MSETVQDRTKVTIVCH